MLGVNTTDKREFVEQALAKYELKFSNIYDTSTEAVDAIRAYEDFGPAAPLTYVIDRDGKVVKAWYGYDKEKTNEMLRALDLRERN